MHDRAGLDRPALLRLRPPRPPGRDVHREPQPRAVQRHQAVPRRRRRRSAWSPGWPRSATWSLAGACAATRRGRAPSASATCSTSTPPTCSSLAPVAGRRLKVVVDAGNGMAGPHRAGRLRAPRREQVEVVPMYFELDGTFPNHEANPIEPENLRDLQARGAWPRAPTSAWPSTATPTAASSSTSRAGAVSPSTLTALIAARELRREPGRERHPQPDHQPRRARDRHASSAARPVRTRVGHSFIKATMAETDAVFGGEHSGHFYFRDFWRADSGMLAALHTLAALAETDRPLSRAAGRVRALRRQRRDQLDRRRPGRRSSPSSRRRTPVDGRRRSTTSTG